MPLVPHRCPSTLLAFDPTKSDSANVTISEIAGSGPFTGVLTYHNDNSRTGQNLNESVLSPANVTQSKFGKLFSYPLDGQVFTQPLYVYKVPIDGQNHNVIYVATEHHTVYAFDADNKASSALWSVSFLNSAEGVTPVPSSGLDSPINPEIGVTSTPVIDFTCWPPPRRTATTFIVAYDASTLHQIATWNDTPNGERGGIWQSGCGLSADSAGNFVGNTDAIKQFQLNSGLISTSPV